MKRSIWLVAVLSLVFVGFTAAGCKKQQADAAKTTDEAAYQLRLTLTNATQQVRNLYFDKVEPGMHYENYRDAITALEQMASDPSLNEGQKKLANQLKDLLQAKAGGSAHP